VVEVGRLDIRKQKLQTSDVADVFQAYSDVCSRNVRRHCSADLPQSSRALNFSSEEITDLDVFRRYTNLCATRATATFSPTVGSISNKDNQHVYNQPVNTTFTHTEVADHNHPFLSIPAKEWLESLDKSEGLDGLKPVQQALILAQCLMIDKNTPHDEMQRWDMASYIEAIDS
nr:tetratricopeptide repeat protein 27 homolog [Tanacetum cinerariifolium]